MKSTESMAFEVLREAVLLALREYTDTTGEAVTAINFDVASAVDGDGKVADVDYYCLRAVIVRG